MNGQQIHTVRGIHYATGSPVAVTTQSGIITDIHPLTGKDAEDLPFIAPGLTDMQVNGYRGIDFNSSSLQVNDIIRCTALLAEQGVTTYFPTVITNTPENMQASLSAIAEACSTSGYAASCIGGIHLEGPFISREEGPVGAHNRQLVRPPDWQLFETLYRASGERIKIVTLSPEWPEAAVFTRRCAALDIIVSIGHTAANTSQIEEVVTAGATMSTHLGNASHQVLPRHPNYIWDQLADERLAAGFIADGFHLPVAVIKVILKVKQHKAILVSDSVSLAGQLPGNYTTPVGGEVVLTAGGKLHLKEQPDVLAGSAQTLLQSVANLYRQNPGSMAACWELASGNPARLLNMPQQNGLQRGAPADFVLFNNNGSSFDVAATYKAGVQVYVKEPN